MFSYRIWFFQSPKLSLVQHAVLLHRSAEPTCQFSIFDSDIGTHKFLKLTYSKCEFRVQDAALIWLLQLAVESLDSLINESVSQSSSLASAPGLSMILMLFGCCSWFFLIFTAVTAKRKPVPLPSVLVRYRHRSRLIWGEVKSVKRLWITFGLHIFLLILLWVNLNSIFPSSA